MAAWSDLFRSATEWYNPADPTEVYGSQVRSDLVRRDLVDVVPGATFNDAGTWWRVQSPTSAYTTDGGITTIRAISRGADGSVQLGGILNTADDRGAWYSDQTAKDVATGAAAVAAFAVGANAFLPSLTGAEGIAGSAGASSAGWTSGYDLAGGGAIGETGASTLGPAWLTTPVLPDVPIAPGLPGGAPLPAAELAAATVASNPIAQAAAAVASNPTVQRAATATLIAALTGSDASSSTSSTGAPGAKPGSSTTARPSIPPVLLLVGAGLLLWTMQ